MYISPELLRINIYSYIGDREDLSILREDRWLLDTEVIYQIIERKARWRLTMLYVSIFDPLCMICKYIDQYPTKKKAKIYASILMRGIRKDARGTLKIKYDGINICYN